jgi:hypothetical protein
MKVRVSKLAGFRVRVALDHEDHGAVQQRTTRLTKAHASVVRSI